MLHFDCDYMGGALPEVLAALAATNGEMTAGYGVDPHTEKAKDLIRALCGQPDADVFLMVGGTQTNATVIDALLRPWQGVVAAESAHINVHESGAIEASGHKVLTLPSHTGKIAPAELRQYLVDFYSDDTWPHMVIPGMVYISFPTELGTLYTRDELGELAAICREYRLPLYLDGARLGYGLAASPDVTLADIAALCDAFYIGGTKQGLLLGEAVVAKRQRLSQFFTVMKQHGGVLAKGRVLGVQFHMLLSDDLYLRASRRAVDLAMQLKQGFLDKGYEVFVDSPTNQQFVRLPNEVIDRLMAKGVSFGYWGPRGAELSEVRFVTSWATRPEEVTQLLALI